VGVHALDDYDDRPPRGIPVSDLVAARRWYESFFGRPADYVVGGELLWEVVEHAWVFIEEQRDHAGGGRITISPQWPWCIPAIGGGVGLCPLLRTSIVCIIPASSWPRMWQWKTKWPV
jgi:hypothetical protein